MSMAEKAEKSPIKTGPGHVIVGPDGKIALALHESYMAELISRGLNPHVFEVDDSEDGQLTFTFARITNST